MVMITELNATINGEIMSRTLKHRFVTMLRKHKNMPRAHVTRRALGQIRQLKMPSLKRMITKLHKEGLISLVRNNTGKPGLVPVILNLTPEGIEWCKQEDAKVERQGY